MHTSFVLPAALVCVISFVMYSGYSFQQSQSVTPHFQVYQPEELWKLTHDARLPFGVHCLSDDVKLDSPLDANKPLYLVVLGAVFDVTVGGEYYRRPEGSGCGPKGVGYHVFIGIDSSLSFQSGNWVTSVEDVRSGGPTVARAVVKWLKFYLSHKSYRQIGVVQGLYYDAAGNRRSALDEVERLAAEADRRESLLQQMQFHTFQQCSTSFQSSSKETTATCSDPHHVPHHVIAKVPWETAGESSTRRWCSCFDPNRRDDGGIFSESGAHLTIPVAPDVATTLAQHAMPTTEKIHIHAKQFEQCQTSTCVTRE